MNLKLVLQISNVGKGLMISHCFVLLKKGKSLPRIAQIYVESSNLVVTHGFIKNKIPHPKARSIIDTNWLIIPTTNLIMEFSDFS